MKNQANELRMVNLQNQRILARIAQRMLEPSQIDNHNTWQRSTLVAFMTIRKDVNPAIHNLRVIPFPPFPVSTPCFLSSLSSVFPFSPVRLSYCTVFLSFPLPQSGSLNAC